MGFLEDILSALDRIPVWKRLQGLSTEVDGLKARIAELENKLDGKWPADVSRFCGERAVRLSVAIPERAVAEAGHAMKASVVCAGVLLLLFAGEAVGAGSGNSGDDIMPVRDAGG